MVGIHIGTTWAPLFAFLKMCYEKILHVVSYADIIEAFNSNSRYIGDFLYMYIDNTYFEQMVNHIYPTELQLNNSILLILKPPF